MQNAQIFNIVWLKLTDWYFNTLKHAEFDWHMHYIIVLLSSRFNVVLNYSVLKNKISLDL